MSGPLAQVTEHRQTFHYFSDPYYHNYFFLSHKGKLLFNYMCHGLLRFQQHRDASCHQGFPPLQGKAPKEIHAILTETLACILDCALDYNGRMKKRQDTI